MSFRYRVLELPGEMTFVREFLPRCTQPTIDAHFESAADIEWKECQGIHSAMDV